MLAFLAPLRCLAWQGTALRPSRGAFSPLRLASTAEAATPDAPATPKAPPKVAPVPVNFNQAIEATYAGAAAAMADGKQLLEVEFPPLSTDLMDSPDCSAEMVAKANVRLAVDLATKFVVEKGLKVAIMVPDNPELEQAVDQVGSDEPFPNVKLHCLVPTVGEQQSLGDLFAGIFGKGRGKVVPVAEADVYILTTFTCQELPQLEDLHLQDPAKTIIFLNLKLDTLRGDLGLPAFPPKDLQYRFLSRVLPVYYLRVRSYAKNVNRPPYLVSYQGALFRSYPSYWQTMLDVGQGKYKCVNKDAARPNLGAFKVQLGDALGLGDEGAVNTFFRQGYKFSTWWEDDVEKEEHSDWRN